MIVLIRGTIQSHNNAAHVTSLLSGLSSIKQSRKSIILQFCQDVPVESLLIGKQLSDTKIEEGILFDDTGIDALIRRVETQRLAKEHFDSSCIPALNSDNLLDVAAASTKPDFEHEIEQHEEDIKLLIEYANDVYDDVYIYANGKNKELLEILNKYVDLTIICVPQGNKEDVVSIPQKYFYLVVDYDKNSTYNVRYMKNMYKSKNIICLPYSAEWKDSFNLGCMTQFVGKNINVSSDDVNAPLMSIVDEIINKYYDELPEVEDYPEIPAAEESHIQSEDLEELNSENIEVTEKKRFFSKKTKKIVKQVPVEEIAPIRNSDKASSEKKLSRKELKALQKEEKRKKKKKQNTISEDSWTCSCGAVNTGKFCNECGSLRPEPEPEIEEEFEDEYEEEIEASSENVWICECGEKNTGKFCNNCGLKKPELKPVEKEESKSNTWICECGTENTGKFCNECGASKPAPQKKKPISNQWTCECGQVNTGKFCDNCGSKKPELEIIEEKDTEVIGKAKPYEDSEEWICECGTVNTKKFCVECGEQKPEKKKEWVCPKCNTINPITSKFCAECGSTRI